MDNEVCLALVQSTICHWPHVGANFLRLSVFKDSVYSQSVELSDIEQVALFLRRFNQKLHTLSLNTKSLRKFVQTWGQWQIGLWTSAKQTSLSVKSEKSSPLRKMLSKYWNCYRKNIWQLKNIWRTLEDVKSNSGQLLFSSPNWYFHSYWS